MTPIEEAAGAAEQDRWDMVRRLYEETRFTVAEIALFANVSRAALYKRAKREGWTSTRRPGQWRKPPLPPSAALAALAGDPRATGRAEGGAITRRLWAALDRHLDDIETLEADHGAARAAQNLATLTRTLETLIDVERGMTAQAQAAPDEGPMDLDEFRDQIAKRLEALLAEDAD